MTEPVVEEVESEKQGILENLNREEIVALGLATGVIFGVIAGSVL